MRPSHPASRTTVAIVALLATTPSAAARAQSQSLYVTSGYDGSVYELLNGAVVAHSAPAAAYPLAVTGNVYTLGLNSGYPGQQYTLGLSPVGAPYYRTPEGLNFYDGASDGSQYNYTIEASSSSGTVYRGALDWTGLAPVFSVGYKALGITYDSQNQSLWIASFSGAAASSTISQYSLGGTLLSTFTPAIGSAFISALAYDPADQTLWFSRDPYNTGTLYEYDRSGTQIQTVTSPVHYMYGGEFAISGERTTTSTPEPATLGLVATGLAGLAGALRRRRSRSGYCH